MPRLGVLTLSAVVCLLVLTARVRSSTAQEPKSGAPVPSATSQPAQAVPTDAAHPASTTQPAPGMIREKPLAAGRNKKAQTAEEAAAAAATQAAKPGMDLSRMKCSVCHTCENPTEEVPCLYECLDEILRHSRSVAEVIADAAHETLPNKVVILLDSFDWGERRFMPVLFNHKVHADMGGMAGGCEVCHHHTAQGKLHPPCRTCHRAEYAPTPGEEMRMPSLKGAYHRQCMGCHRDWSHATKCSLCHLPKGEQTEPIPAEQLLAKGDIAGTHPPIENPAEILVKTEHEDGPNVMFRHKEHVERYGYECERCHREAGCARCHEAARKPKETLAHVKERGTHDACFNCHEDDACERCHSSEEKPSPKPFDHNLTGFALGKYHGQLTCRACHTRLYFLRKLSGDCVSCHKDWEPETFKHEVTGQALDDSHAVIECGDCHKDGRYINPPSCEECHEDDITFPRKRPGPTTQPAANPTPSAAPR